MYRWSFEAGGLPESDFREGSNGGELTVGGSGSDAVPLFQRTKGVSDTAPGVLNASRNSYGSDAGAQVNSFGSPLKTERSAGTFTVTMWIKPELPSETQPQARLFNLSPATNEQAAQSVLLSLESGSFSFSVNGSPFIKADLTEPVVKVNEWVFLAFCYDGLTDNPYYSQQMAIATSNASTFNAAILAGDLSRPARVISKVAISTGAPNYNVSPGKVGFDGLLVAVGSSNSRYDRSFVGWIDDVRIYNGVLPLAEIERVRLEAVGQ